MKIGGGFPHIFEYIFLLNFRFLALTNIYKDPIILKLKENLVEKMTN